MATIIFDLDGTLIDSAPDLRAAANKVLLPAGGRPITEGETRKFIGDGVSAFVLRAMRASGLDETPERHAQLLQEYMRHYEVAGSLTRVYDGVAAALALLRQGGHVLGVCTNKPAALANIALSRFGLAGEFECVIGGDSLELRKPDPAPLRAVANALGTSPAFYVGDSEVDAETAAAAAVPFALYSEGYRRGPVAGMIHAGRFDHYDLLPGLLADLLDDGDPTGGAVERT